MNVEQSQHFGRKGIPLFLAHIFPPDHSTPLHISDVKHENILVHSAPVSSCFVARFNFGARHTSGHYYTMMMRCVMAGIHWTLRWARFTLGIAISDLLTENLSGRWISSPVTNKVNPRPTGGGLFRAPPLVFLRYLLNRCRYHRQTCSTLSPNIFTHCVKILKSRVS